MRTAFITAVAGLASASLAQIEHMSPTGLSTDRIGHIYYNMSTGEMVRIGAGTARNDSFPVWVNENYDQCSFFEWFYTTLTDPAESIDNHWADWGDITPNSVVDCMTFLYFTTVSDTGSDGEDGFEMDVSFFDGVDADELASPTATDHLFLTYTIAGLPGAGSGGVPHGSSQSTSAAAASSRSATATGSTIPATASTPAGSASMSTATGSATSPTATTSATPSARSRSPARVSPAPRPRPPRATKTRPLSSTAAGTTSPDSSTSAATSAPGRTSSGRRGHRRTSGYTETMSSLIASPI